MNRLRRARLILLTTALALVTAGCVTFTGNKVVTGGQSDGPFVVRITCPGADPETDDLTFIGESTETSDEFELPEGATTCTITEIEQAGATSVTYECGEVTIDDEIPSANNTAVCTEGADGLTVAIFLDTPAEVSVSFTVINDFTSPTPPTTLFPEPAPVEAVAPAPVPAAPAFTG